MCGWPGCLGFLSDSLGRLRTIRHGPRAECETAHPDMCSVPWVTTRRPSSADWSKHGYHGFLFLFLLLSFLVNASSDTFALIWMIVKLFQETRVRTPERMLQGNILVIITRWFLTTSPFVVLVQALFCLCSQSSFVPRRISNLAVRKL
ncbi:uncharacterized protein B0I36DRAFT_18295 [Microdochium trichocladiopsis]|uniref:Uncharacterized protein n=1 Tax=Microdochium trichocladiopsis TaxID=1682393 RepID=A0A9P8YL60_9PEZI|nr:uncharacterized protein B0I36DRAFT_18295 [Microdochium trichocladiopsis]KAH7041019.1 hypothetical protein B0I36DRAFT_18295 [Microdochium trichocladiopsis]